MTDSSRRYSFSDDSEAKRKWNALERAKANFLCSQLRLRLQYAKLKVDHGWQRQNLDEVENLYFRHSQTGKQPTPSSPSSYTLAALDTPTPVSTTSQPTPPSSQPPFSSSPEDPLISSSNAAAPHNSALSIPRPANLDASAQVMSVVRTPRTRRRAPPCKKGKERDISWMSPETNGFYMTPSSLTSPSPVRTRRPGSHRVSPVSPPFPPASFTGSLPSSAKYLASTYISSSPFPINVPIPGTGSPPPSTFGGGDQPLTYDSFWSTHSSWTSHAALAGAQPTMGVERASFSAPSVPQS